MGFWTIYIALHGAGAASTTSVVIRDLFIDDSLFI